MKVEGPPGRVATNNNQNCPPLESQHTSSVQNAQPPSLLELQAVPRGLGVFAPREYIRTKAPP